jgi:hypothetical protein
MATYARQVKDTDLIAWATEIKVRAERRCGEMLQESTRAPGGRPPENPLPRGRGFVQPVTLEAIGVSYKQSSRWQRLATMTTDAFETAVSTAKAIAGAITTAFVLRQPRRATQAATVPTCPRRL